MGVGPCTFDRGEEKRWDDYVDRHPHTGHGHLNGWREVIAQTYGHRPYYLWSCTSGKVEGILPLIFMRDLRLRRCLVSMPFLDDGGICADNPETARALYDAAMRLAEKLGVAAIDLRHRRESGLGLEAHGKKVTLALNLVPDPDQMWKDFNAKVRNQVRKAEKSGLTIHWHQAEGLQDFYDVFAINMRSLGSPVHSLKLFEHILKSFEGRVKLILVQKGETTVGGALCLLFKKTVLVPWASSLVAYRSLCPNNLLYWEAIRWACENGFQRFDFGRSSPGSGTFHFKKQWGAVEEALHWESGTNGLRAPEMMSADDPRYDAVTALWRKLPLSVTRWVGPLIRGRLSH